MATKGYPTKPKLIGLLFTICSGVSLGALLAIFFLVSTQVVQMSKLPSEGYDTHSQYVVPYVKGKVASGESLELKKNLRRLENRMAGEIVLAEQDVNWMLKDWCGMASEKDAEVQSGSPNVSLRDEGMVLSLPVTVNANTEKSFKVVLQVNTRFNEESQFEASDMYINCLRLPALGLGSLIRNKVAEIELPQRLQEGFNAVSSIKHQDGGLVLNIGG